MLKGLPASGKSTYAKELVSQGWKRINKDDLREMIDNGNWSKSNEKKIIDTRNQICHSFLIDGLNVVVDDTNFHQSHEQDLKQIAEMHNAEFEIKFIDTPVDECIKRDKVRQKSVGKEVIMKMYRTYIKQIPEIIPKDISLNNAIIVDIDGTLAHMKNRSPYDYTKVDTDVIDETIRDIISLYKQKENLKIIICSGRKSEARELTEKWLKDNNVEYDELFMRESEDNRKDCIVKQEIYENNIKGKYNVLFVLDDRDQVVNMWREQGLKCLQVNEGNF